MNLFKTFINDVIYGNKITFVIRVVLGAMLIFSGYFKSLDLDTFSKVIMKYNIIPEFLAPYPAIVIPFLEMLLGLFLIIGLKIRASAFISMMLMLMFTIFITINFIRGESFDCGCFELSRLGLGISDDISLKVIIRDIIFLFLFFVIYLAERHLFSLENLLIKLRLKFL